MFYKSWWTTNMYVYNTKWLMSRRCITLYTLHNDIIIMIVALCCSRDCDVTLLPWLSHCFICPDCDAISLSWLWRHGTVMQLSHIYYCVVTSLYCEVAVINLHRWFQCIGLSYDIVLFPYKIYRPIFYYV